MQKYSLFQLTKRQGFSLVETVLALGIMGLAITALLGLLPHGIELSKRAANISAVSRIVSNITGRMSIMHFGNIAGIQTTRLMFDDQGSNIEDSGGSEIDIAFVAEVTVNRAGAILPGSSAPQSMVLPVVIKVAATPNRTFNFENAALSSYQTIPLLIGPSVQ